MNYKKIALFFLLLFSSQEASSMQWLLEEHPIISFFFPTIFIGSIIIIVNKLLSITGKFILKNRYSGMLARFFIAIGGSTITLQHAYDEINYYPWSTLKKIDQQKECALLTFLIDLGINPNIKYDNGSILTRACHYNDAQLVQKILNAGADPNDQNLKYIPPIKESSRIHLDMGGIPYSTTLNYEAGPLVIAFLHNNFEIIKILTMHNAQPLLPYNGNKSEPLLSPIQLIIQREYPLFNHLLDYHIRQENPTLESRDTSLYKYWLIQQIVPQELCGAFKNVVDKHIMPFYGRITIFKNFDESLESLCLFYNFTTEQKKMLYTKRTEILQTRRDNKNSFLPISMPTEEILQTLTF